MTGFLAPPVDLFTTAVIDLLRTAGRPVYDGAFTGDPARPPYWYSVAYTLPGGAADPMPDLDDDPDEVTVAWQVTTVSNRRDQAQAGARILAALLLGRAFGRHANPLLLPDGWADIRRRADDVLPGVNRTGEQPPYVFSVPARYQLTFART